MNVLRVEAQYCLSPIYRVGGWVRFLGSNKVGVGGLAPGNKSSTSLEKRNNNNNRPPGKTKNT